MAKKVNLPDYDVAIVGGGVSGIYTAWRMITDGLKQSPQLKQWAKERGSLKIGVFEGSERLGGRLHSAIAPSVPDLPVEIGGMRYMSEHFYVKSLVENKFKLPTTPQTVDVSNNIWYLRGKRLRELDGKKPETLPYNLSKEEKEWLRTPGQSSDTAANLIGYAVNKIFPEINKKGLQGNTLRNWLKTQKYKGIPIYQWGFWNLIAPQLSHEAYELAITTVGYDCLGFNTNALDAIVENFSFTPTSTYSLLVNGYEEIVHLMEGEFKKAGGAVITNQWLESFEDVKLADKTTGVSLTFVKGKKHLQLTSRCIVLSMPRHSMELLQERGPVMDPERSPEFRTMLNAVEPIDLYKMCLVYDYPWWEKAIVTNGRSLTDIPVRQCYYWGQGKLSQKAILMAYNDATSSSYWGGLRRQELGDNDAELVNETFKPKKAIAAAPTKGLTPWYSEMLKNWQACEAPKRMMDEMHRQIVEMHGIENAPAPIDAAFMDWGDAPYGGAVHFWNPGFDSDKVMNAMVQPVKNFPCYTCGEAFSQVQTWVEGALDTAELVLQNKFKLKIPEWYSEPLTNLSPANKSKDKASKPVAKASTKTKVSKPKTATAKGKGKS